MQLELFDPSPILLAADEILDLVLSIPEQIVALAELGVQDIWLLQRDHQLVKPPHQFVRVVGDGVGAGQTRKASVVGDVENEGDIVLMGASGEGLVSVGSDDLPIGELDEQEDPLDIIDGLVDVSALMQVGVIDFLRLQDTSQQLVQGVVDKLSVPNLSKFTLRQETVVDDRRSPFVVAAVVAIFHYLFDLVGFPLRNVRAPAALGRAQSMPVFCVLGRRWKVAVVAYFDQTLVFIYLRFIPPLHEVILFQHRLHPGYLLIGMFTSARKLAISPLAPICSRFSELARAYLSYCSFW